MLALIYLGDKDSTNPLVQCPYCGFIGHLQFDFSYLKAGFGGIKEGDEDNLDLQECGKCNKKMEW